MKNVWIALGIIALILIGIAVFWIGTKNALIAKDENVKSSWSTIDTQLQRRADLIPNLVASVKGYMKHEEKVIASVSNARAAMMAAKSPEEKAGADQKMSSALGRLFAIAEKYPDLKANTNFIRLQDEIAGTENRISVARTRYNAIVREYNSAIRSFPGNLFASGMGLEKALYFQPPAGQDVTKAPKVSFE